MKSARSRVPGGRPRSAFTLVEMMVAVAVMGILTAVAVPWSRRGARPDTAEQQLAAVYRAAREAAVDRGTSATVVVDLADGTYVLSAAAQGSGWRTTLQEGRLDLPSDARLGGGSAGGGLARLRFDASGGIAGDRVTISRGGRRYEVETERWTGTIRVVRR